MNISKERVQTLIKEEIDKQLFLARGGGSAAMECAQAIINKLEAIFGAGQSSKSEALKLADAIRAGETQDMQIVSMLPEMEEMEIEILADMLDQYCMGY